MSELEVKFYPCEVYVKTWGYVKDIICRFSNMSKEVKPSKKNVCKCAARIAGRTTTSLSSQMIEQGRSIRLGNC